MAYVAVTTPPSPREIAARRASKVKHLVQLSLQHLPLYRKHYLSTTKFTRQAKVEAELFIARLLKLCAVEKRVANA